MILKTIIELAVFAAIQAGSVYSVVQITECGDLCWLKASLRAVGLVMVNTLVMIGAYFWVIK